MADFRWIAWNIDHIAKHGVTVAEAEHVVNHAARPYPTIGDDGKWLVRGPAEGGQYLQVIFLIEEDHAVFVIHARPLTDQEKRRLRRRRR